MRIRKTLQWLLITSMLLSVTMANPSNGASTTIGVEPYSIVNSELGPGSTFSVEIWVRNVDPNSLVGVEFHLSYNTTVLTATAVTYGGIFGTTYLELKKEIDDAAGDIWYALGQMLGETPGPEPPGTTNGKVCIITFKVDSIGNSILNLEDTKLAGTMGTEIQHEALDGYFDNRPVEKVSPVACFYWTPEFPIVGETVTFVSTSFDPDGRIVSWIWDFGDGTTGSGETVTHDYTVEGMYTVILTVTDNDGLTASSTGILTVLPPPPPPEVYQADLTGRSAWPEHHHYDVAKDEDFYNTLYARVTNIGTEEVNVKVVFTVKDARDGIIIGSLETTAKLLVGETKDLTVQFYPQEFGWTEGAKAKFYVNATCYYYNPNIGEWIEGKTKTFSFAVVP